MGTEGLAELVGGAQRGDQESWKALVRRYDKMVWRIAREQGLDEALAGDVAQTAWLRLAERIDTIKDPERVGSWLATTVRREAWNAARKARREAPSEPEEQTDDVDFEAAMISDERSVRLWRGLRSLDETCQRLLRLLLAEVPYEEIAAVLERPIGWVGPTRSRCLAKLGATPEVRSLADG